MLGLVMSTGLSREAEPGAVCSTPPPTGPYGATGDPECSLLCPQVVAVYNLTLQVADMSGDGLTATASAIITLEDVNDNAPGFTRDEVLPPTTPTLGTVLPSSGSRQRDKDLSEDKHRNPG